MSSTISSSSGSTHTHATTPDQSVRVRDMIAAEWIKFRILRPPRRLLLTAILLAALSAVVLILSFPVTRGVSLAKADPADIVSASALGLDVAAVVLVALGAWFVGIEFHDHALATSFSLLRRRRTFLIAKASVIVAASAIVGVIVAVTVTALAIALAWTTSAGVDGALESALSPGHIRMLTGSILMPVSYALFSVYGAVIARSTVGGVLGALALIVGSMIAGWLPESAASIVQPLLPLGAIHNLNGVAEVGSSEYIGSVPAVMVLAVWVGVVGFIAASRLKSLDV